MPARVVLGVGAGIAAYKACELLRLLTESGHQVRVVPTPDALRFVGEVTWAALSGKPPANMAIPEVEIRGIGRPKYGIRYQLFLEGNWGALPERRCGGF